MIEVDEYTKIIIHNMLCDYLLLTHNIEEELEHYKELVVSEYFIRCMKDFLTKLNDNEIGYPPIAQENGLKILKFISDLKEDDDTLNLEGECFEQVLKMNDFSYEKYNTEYELKQTSIGMLIDKPYTIWDLSDFEESLKYDFIVIVALNSNDKDFLSINLPEFLMNKKFIYSVNKLIYATPDVLDNIEFQKKVRTVLKSNLEIIKNIDDDVKNVYLSRNGRELDSNEREIFKEMNETALMSLKDLEKQPFSIDVLMEYYDFLKVENYIYLDSDDDKRIALDRINLSAICNYIELIENIEKMPKKRLIDAMDSKKQNLSKEEREEYYDYLGRVNRLDIPEDNKKFINLMKKTDVPTYLKTLVKIQFGKTGDYDKIGSIRNDLENFEAIMLNKDIEISDFKYSLRRFIYECAPMFMNSKICDSAIKILSKNNDYSSNMLKKKLLKNKKDIHK